MNQIVGKSVDTTLKADKKTDELNLLKLIIHICTYVYYKQGAEGFQVIIGAFKLN